MLDSDYSTFFGVCQGEIKNYGLCSNKGQASPHCRNYRQFRNTSKNSFKGLRDFRRGLRKNDCSGKRKNHNPDFRQTPHRRTAAHPCTRICASTSWASSPKGVLQSSRQTSRVRSGDVGLYPVQFSVWHQWRKEEQQLTHEYIPQEQATASAFLFFRKI